MTYDLPLDDDPPTPDELDAWSDPAYNAEPPSDDSEACSFLANDGAPEEGPCPNRAEQDRDIEGVEFPACPTHLERGGILHLAARRRLTLALVARRSIDTHYHAVTDDGEQITTPRFCERCGARLFAGNTSGACADCNEQSSAVFDAIWPAAMTDTPPRHPFSLDRFVYEAPGMAAWRAAHSPGARR